MSDMDDCSKSAATAPWPYDLWPQGPRAGMCVCDTKMVEPCYVTSDGLRVCAHCLRRLRGQWLDEPTEPRIRAFTQCGFEDFANFTDSHGNTVVVRESSEVASEPHVWVFCHRDYGGVRMDASPHLDKTQALRLAQALTDFAYRREDDDGDDAHVEALLDEPSTPKDDVDDLLRRRAHTDAIVHRVLMLCAQRPEGGAAQARVLKLGLLALSEQAAHAVEIARSALATTTVPLILDEKGELRK